MLPSHNAQARVYQVSLQQLFHIETPKHPKPALKSPNGLILAHLFSCCSLLKLPLLCYENEKSPQLGIASPPPRAANQLKVDIKNASKRKFVSGSFNMTKSSVTLTSPKNLAVFGAIMSPLRLLFSFCKSILQPFQPPPPSGAITHSGGKNSTPTTKHITKIFSSKNYESAQ